MKTFYLITGLLFSTHLLIGQFGDVTLADALKTRSGDVYGTYCGIAGTPPAARGQLEKMVYSRDINGLTSWLDSPNLVLQTYAAEGLIRLNSVITMTPELAQKVEGIRRKKSKIPTCHGCVMEELTIKECLAKVESGYNIDPPTHSDLSPK